MFPDSLYWFHATLKDGILDVLKSLQPLTQPSLDLPPSSGIGNLATKQQAKNSGIPIVQSVQRIRPRGWWGSWRLRSCQCRYHGDARSGWGGHGGFVCLPRQGRDGVPPVGPVSHLTGPDLFLPFPAAGDVRPQPVLRYLVAVLCPVRSPPEAGCPRWDRLGAPWQK
jgi:hypothetical protein